MAFTHVTTRARRAFAGAACAALLALAACGGGDPIERFQPSRIVSFGDEASVIAQNGTAPNTTGTKYTVNAVDTTTTPATVVCTSNPIWIQNVASAFNLAFKACSSSSSATGLIYAAPKAKVADVTAQIDSFVAAQTPFSHGDVVTVMAGMYDVLEQYALSPATPEATLVATVRQRGKALAEQVNRIALTGAPVIVMRIPSLGLTPYAISQGGEAVRLLTTLSAAFNTEMQQNLINDGHLIGLVYADQDLQSVAANYTAYGLTDITHAACLAAVNAADKLDASVLLGCTSDAATLATGATALNYLWAGNLQLSYLGHSRLGSLAAARALNNPF